MVRRARGRPAGQLLDPAAVPRGHLDGADGVLIVPGTDPSQVGAVAAAGGHVLTDLRPRQRGLEDLFFQLTTAS